MFSSQIYCVTFVNHRCTGGFTYFALHFIHATFCIEPRSTDELTVREKDGKVYVAMSDKLLFQSGSARLDKRGEEALGKLAEVLNKQTDIDVFIEGHTDNKPINTVQFKDNWDLSVIRATSVVRILIKNYNVNPLQIQPSGRGEYMPVDDNETIEGRSKNRRTEIIMAPKLDKLFQMLQSSEESK